MQLVQLLIYMLKQLSVSKETSKWRELITSIKSGFIKVDKHSIYL